MARSNYLYGSTIGPEPRSGVRIRVPKARAGPPPPSLASDNDDDPHLSFSRRRHVRESTRGIYEGSRGRRHSYPLSDTPVSRPFPNRTSLPNSPPTRQLPRSALRPVPHGNSDKPKTKHAKRVTFNPIVEFDDDIKMEPDTSDQGSCIDDGEGLALRMPQDDEEITRRRKGRPNVRFEDCSDDTGSLIDSGSGEVLRPPRGREGLRQVWSSSLPEKKRNSRSKSPPRSPFKADSSIKQSAANRMNDEDIRSALKEDVRHALTEVNARASLIGGRVDGESQSVIIATGPPKLKGIIIEGKDGRKIVIGPTNMPPMPTRQTSFGGSANSSRVQKPVFVRKAVKAPSAPKEPPKEEPAVEKKNVQPNMKLPETIVKKKQIITAEEEKSRILLFPKIGRPVSKTPKPGLPLSKKRPVAPPSKLSKPPPPSSQSLSSVTSSLGSSSSSSGSSGWQVPRSDLFKESKDGGEKPVPLPSKPEPPSQGKEGSKSKSKSKSPTPPKSRSTSKSKRLLNRWPSPAGLPSLPVPVQPSHLPTPPQNLGLAAVQSWDYQPDVPVSGAGEGWSAKVPPDKKSSSSSTTSSSTSGEANRHSASSGNHSVHSNEHWMSGALPAASLVSSSSSSAASTATVKPPSSETRRRISKGFRHVAPLTHPAQKPEQVHTSSGSKYQESRQSRSSRRSKKTDRSAIPTAEGRIVPIFEAVVPEILVSPVSGYAPSSNYQPPTVESDRTSQSSRRSKTKTDLRSKNSLSDDGPILEEMATAQDTLIVPDRGGANAKQWDQPAEEVGSRKSKKSSESRKNVQQSHGDGAESTWDQWGETAQDTLWDKQSGSSETSSKSNSTVKANEAGMTITEQRLPGGQDRESREARSNSSKKSSKFERSAKESDTVAAPAWELQEPLGGGQEWEVRSHHSKESSNSRKSGNQLNTAPKWGVSGNNDVGDEALKAGSGDPRKSESKPQKSTSKTEIISNTNSKKSSSKKASDEEPVYQYLHGVIPVRISRRRLH
ncbi:hypothetical protein NA57DRAFT_78672 [Rhizodiscina lignyota]|uniref:Uncharacterized protein n=1 Tax=Rhizodiscina lignyota TaxID=1504668 RepID=A0A9P4IC93_9PEZI|nr:hypothetical protein NA57DRAFT_78672 [Rhizodiscina lignyota]